MTKTKGVLLLALGHPFYGRYAHNLAMSLRFSCPDLKIALAWADKSTSHYNDERFSFFDELIEVPEEYYTRNGKKEYIKAKTAMYELSPWDETIFLDVDMLWLPQRSINILFEELKDIDFTMQNRGFEDLGKDDLKKDYCMWADITEVKKAYKIKEGKYYQLHSEFVYFKKNKKVKKLFDDARKIYDNLKVNSFVFAGAIPDELPFAISTILNKTYPHKDFYTPVYWEVIEKKNLPAHMMYQEYYAYSTGGSYHSKEMKKFYKNINEFYGNHHGAHHHFPLYDKRGFLPERSNI